MKTLFDFTDYREFLSYYVSHPQAQRGLRAELAKAMQCQAAYLSQVLNGNAELTEDHAFRLVNHLQFSTTEKEYFVLLVRISRASSHELKTHLRDQAKVIAKAATKVDGRVAAKKLSEDDAFTKYYFGSWIPNTIHVATSSPHYQTAEALAKRLGLPEKKVLECLKALEEHQLVIKKNRNEYTYQGHNFHLPKTSPLEINYQMHTRLQAIKALQASNENDLHVSATFTLGKDEYASLRKLFLDAVEKSHKKIAAGDTEEIFGMCLDLFQVV
ncbi:TIGR02147 family protein [Bdellovibrio sp. HCB290]|uniref:TIGR02147 family protein n=1 Tax=Bdellovibrio sp. HCB290 TaxID=3394356 RepID=UPI0039B577E9